MSLVQYVFLFIAIGILGIATMFTLPMVITAESKKDFIPCAVFGSIFSILVFLGIIGVFG